MPNTIRRTDLEAVPVKFPNYLVDTLLPYLEKPQTAGRLYYQKWATDVAAQTGRSTSTIAAINANTIAANDITFSCSEVIARIRMGYDQVAGFGGIETAELAMGRQAKRAFYNNIEAQAATAVIDTESATDVSSDIFGGITAEVAEMQDLAKGPVALVLSNHNFIQLRKNADIAERMANIGIIAGLNADNVQLASEQLAAVFGVAKVLVGSDDQWYTGVTNKNRVALTVLPDIQADPAEEVQFGRTIYFAYDSDIRHFKMESFFDDLNKAHVVDALGHVALTVLNANLNCTLQITA